MDSIYEFFHPKLSKQNDLFIRLCIRNPYLLKNNGIELNFSRKLLLTTFLNNSPIIHGSIVYSLYFITLKLIGLRKPAQWARYKFFKTLNYPVLVYSAFFVSVRCLFPNQIIELLFKPEIQQCQQKGYFDNQLLYDKVAQLNVLSQTPQKYQQNDISKKLLDFLGLKNQNMNLQNTHGKLQLHQDAHIRKIFAINIDEDDEKLQKIKWDISEFFDKFNTK